MKPKTTIVLVVLLILVGLGVWVSKVIQKHAEEKADSPAGKVFPLAGDEAKKLTVENRDGTKFVFVHTNGRWNMIEPRLLPARAGAVGSIVRMITDLTYRRALTTGDAAAPSETVTGLDRPRWIVAMTDSANRTWTLEVGAAAPNVGGGEETYVRAGDKGPVYVVAKNLTNLLHRDVKDYRDMAVLSDVQPDKIVAVRVQGRQNYTLRKTEGLWELTQPFTARADAASVRELLRKLTFDLQARRFVAEAAVSPTPYGLDRPQLIVTVTARKSLTGQTETQPAAREKTYTLLLGNHRGKGVCAAIKGKPEVFTLPEESLETLQPDFTSLLPKRVLTFNPADVDRVDVQRKDETIVLQRNGGGWSMTKPFPGPAETKPVDELLNVLANLQIESWIPPLGSSSPSGKPIVSFTLHLRNGTTRTLRVRSHSRAGGTLFCRRENAGALAAVKARNSEALYWPAVKFRPRTILPISPDAEVLGMTIDRPDGSYVLTRCDDAWILVAPVAGRADGKAVQAILKTLAGLEATKIMTLGETLPKGYADAKDRITVSLTTRGEGAEPPRTRRLVVVKIANQVFAWREGQPVVAVGLCSPSLYTTLNQPLGKAK